MTLSFSSSEVWPGGRRSPAILPFLLFLACFLCLMPDSAKAGSNPRYASFVMDADSGMVLYERYADKRLHPASLVKMMTLALTFDALQSGRLRLRDRIYISSHAESMVPSKLDLPAGSSITVEDAIYALVTKSANDVAVALGEKIAGTESQFAVLMNRKARALGMARTHFRNASGLHHPAQKSTARDMARLATYLLTRHKQYYHYFSTSKFSYNGKTYRNHNRLMNSYDGMDGLKTGYIRASGFNLVASAKRGNRRIIGVVFGGRTSQTRNAHMKSLLDRSFSKLDRIMVASSKMPPIPQPKPDIGVKVAAIAPAAGKPAQQARYDGRARWADLNPALMESKTFRAMIGEGDYDPGETRRLETGLLALAAHSGFEFRTAAQSIEEIKRDWAIQVGAFTSRVKIDRVIEDARGRLPADLAHAAPVIVPLKTSKRWLFRGRLKGFSKDEAGRACRYLPECLMIAPQSD